MPHSFIQGSELWSLKLEATRPDKRWAEGSKEARKKHTSLQLPCWKELWSLTDRGWLLLDWVQLRPELIWCILSHLDGLLKCKSWYFQVAVAGRHDVNDGNTKLSTKVSQYVISSNVQSSQGRQDDLVLLNVSVVALQPDIYGRSRLQSTNPPFQGVHIFDEEDTDELYTRDSVTFRVGTLFTSKL